MVIKMRCFQQRQPKIICLRLKKEAYWNWMRASVKGYYLSKCWAEMMDHAASAYLSFKSVAMETENTSRHLSHKINTFLSFKGKYSTFTIFTWPEIIIKMMNPCIIIYLQNNHLGSLILLNGVHCIWIKHMDLRNIWNYCVNSDQYFSIKNTTKNAVVRKMLPE